MLVSIRINGTLAQKLGTSRLNLQVETPATVQNVLVMLGEQYPNSAEIINIAIPFVAGRHLDKNATLKQGQQIALLMPAAGG